ncbi:MAG: hypothetical protein H6729_08865 [Deltaproteobacteria bacterium]|nr:hypothetical protein [Deltaproteobacteria bacterium]
MDARAAGSGFLISAVASWAMGTGCCTTTSAPRVCGDLTACDPTTDDPDCRGGHRSGGGCGRDDSCRDDGCAQRGRDGSGAVEVARFLASYDEALRAKDAERVWALSAASVRARVSAAEFKTRLSDGANGGASATRPGTTPQREEIVVTTEGGRKLTLVREAGALKVAEGGVETPPGDSPESALRTFFFGVTHRDSAAVRSVMPQSVEGQFRVDDVLWAHLEAWMPRIERARAALDGVRAGVASVDGDTAEIVYRAGASVTLVREGGRWCVMDID